MRRTYLNGIGSSEDRILPTRFACRVGATHPPPNHKAPDRTRIPQGLPITIYHLLITQLRNYQTTQLPPPRLLHPQRVLLHHGAFAQNPPAAAELLQRLKKRLQIQVRFSQRQVILLALRPILDA